MVGPAPVRPAAKQERRRGATALRKKLWRDMRQNAMQFLTIVLLCALGTWVYSGLDGAWRMLDLSAETYIVIDGNGNWSYYQRAPGAEPAEMDCGVFTYSMDEVSTYYADSTMYDGVSYRVFEVDEDSLVWGDEGVYYMME